MAIQSVPGSTERCDLPGRAEHPVFQSRLEDLSRVGAPSRSAARFPTAGLKRVYLPPWWYE